MPADGYHTKEVDQVCSEFSTHPERGINGSEVEQRRSKYGENKLPDPERISYVRIFLKQLVDFMVLLLVAAAGLSAGKLTSLTFIHYQICTSVRAHYFISFWRFQSNDCIANCSGGEYSNRIFSGMLVVIDLLCMTL